jgi:excisionase family DNA binding protein
MRHYLRTPEAAEYLRCSIRTLAEKTRTNAVPHRKIRGTRACLFVAEELDAWIDGAALEVVNDNGSKIVRPVEAEPARLRGVT